MPERNDVPLDATGFNGPTHADRLRWLVSSEGREAFESNDEDWDSIVGPDPIVAEFGDDSVRLQGRGGVAVILDANGWHLEDTTGG